MIKKTDRLPGKPDPVEIERFQVRYDLQRDGKFGHQCLGQVVEIERAYGSLLSRHRELGVKYAKLLADTPKGWPKVLVGALLMGVVWLIVSVLA